MEFGTWITNDPRQVAGEAKFAEEHGFTHGWVADLPLDFGDVFVCLTLAAAATRTLKLGSWIAAAPFRVPPASVSAIASIHALAPGRMIFGVGMGSYGRAVMGLPPIKLSDFRRWLRTVHDLLRKGEAEYETEGLRRKISFSNREREFVRLDPPIPLYVAASAPKAAAVAGEFGDGFFAGGPLDPQYIRTYLDQISLGAEQIGRRLNEPPCIWETPVCLLRPGETLESVRVIESVGHFVMVIMRMYAAGQLPDVLIPHPLLPSFQAYAEKVLRQSSEEERHLALWDGHRFLRPQDRDYITADAIRWSALVGTREELIERIKALEEAGVTQIAVSPPPDGVRDAITDIEHELISRV